MRKPMNGRRYVVFIVIGMLVVSVAYGAPRAYSYAICSPVEREAIATVPRYDGGRIALKPNLEVGSCQVNYDVQADREDVSDFYRVQLREHGWVRPESDEMNVEGMGKVQFNHGKYYPYGVQDYILYEVSVESYRSNESSVYTHVYSLSG